MKVIVKPHSIQVISTPVNEQEVNVTTVEFEFSEEITEDYVKEAYFTLEDDTYKKIIVNNACEIPGEVLTKVGTVELGVVAYYADPANDELIRYNPKPGYFTSWEGSLRDAENSEPITPSEMEQFETALQDGLTELDNALDDLQEKVDSGYFKGDKGDKGDTGEQGPQGIQGEQGIQGVKGDKGDTGLTGPKGDKGDKGDKGQTGATGSQGPKGDTGATGPAGRDGYVQYTAGDNITIENNVISATGGDLSNYYTKSEVDALEIQGIRSITGSTSNTKIHYYCIRYEASGQPSLGNNNLKPAVIKIMNDYIKHFDTNYRYNHIIIDVKTGISAYDATFYIENWGTTTTPNNSITYDVYPAFYTRTNLSFTYSDGVCTGYTSALNTWPTTTNDFPLLKNNTYTYTPTSDYHPATKKYVDDTIASAITTTLGGSF